MNQRETTSRLLGVVFIVATLSTVSEAVQAVRSAERCERLSGLALPYSTVTSAEPVPAGVYAPGGSGQSFPDLPAFCRVTATVRPTPESDIRMEVWMPVDGWTGTFEGRGSSGMGGAIPLSDMATSLRYGYATAGSNTGHDTPDASYLMDHPESVIDFGIRAGHEVPLKAKAIIEAYYGTGPDFSFINGCGGSAQTAQNAAQRFPTDYDAIAISGLSDKTHHVFHQMWNWAATHDDEASYIPPEKLVVLHNAVDAACDSLDGVTDGVIENPRMCTFDPASIQCAPGTDGNACLTAPQVTAVRKIYAGATNPLTHQQIFAGPELGSEITWANTIDGSEPFRHANNFFKHFVYRDPNWTYESRPVDFATDVALADTPENLVVNALDPDISEFIEAGGKLLLWEGWNDTYIPPQLAIDYYGSVVNRIGPDSARDSVRLFMVPNKEHCGWTGSHGDFDVGAELKRWAETGIAPDRIVISGVTEDGQTRTRPLCQYPQVATYTGAGSTDDARNFTCNTPR